MAADSKIEFAAHNLGQILKDAEAFLAANDGCKMTLAAMDAAARVCLYIRDAGKRLPEFTPPLNGGWGARWADTDKSEVPHA